MDKITLERWNDIKKELISIKKDYISENNDLDNYKSELDSIIEEIPEIEKELSFWLKDKEKIKVKGHKEDLNTWEDQIKDLQKNLQDKKKRKKELISKIEKLSDFVVSAKNEFITRRDSIEERIISEFKTISEMGETNLSKCEFRIIELIDILRDLQMTFEDVDLDFHSFVELISGKISIKNDFLMLSLEAFDVENIVVTPSFIVNFISKYLEGQKTKLMVDLWANIGTFSNQLAKSFDKSIVIGFVDKNDPIKLRNYLSRESIVEWRDVDQLDESEGLDIVIGHKNNTSEFNSIHLKYNGINLDLRDKVEFLQILKASSKLNVDGTAFFIVPQNFLHHREPHNVFSNLEKFGLYIDSILALSEDFYNGWGQVLVIIKKQNPGNVFVGKITPKNYEFILKNIKKRKNGIIPEHGYLTNLKSFYSFNSFLSKLEAIEMAQGLDIVPIKMSELMEEIRFNQNNLPFQDVPNSIFLPHTDLSDVVITKNQLNDDYNQYVQILLKENTVFAEYLSYFFNSPLGKKLRESLKIGSNSSNALYNILNDLEIYIPDFDSQVEAVRVDSFITEILTRNNSYKRELWEKPGNATKLRHTIEKVEGQTDKDIEEWFEILPFPLASILWASRTDSEYDHKVKYLTDFFEAFSEFNFTIMLSGLASDVNFFKEECLHCLRTDRTLSYWYLKPTFGNWNHMGSCLAKTIRRLLEDKEKRPKLLNLFGNPSRDFLATIASRKLYNVLFEVGNYRNKGDAHGPRVHEDVYRNRYKMLESALSRVYSIISNIYNHTNLVIPETGVYREGIHYYNAKKLMGTRSPFKSIKIESDSVMDTSKVYLLTKNQRTPLELFPLFLINNEACYYYNSFNKSKFEAQFVSYHYIREHEIPVPCEKISPYIAYLDSKSM